MTREKFIQHQLVLHQEDIQNIKDVLEDVEMEFRLELDVGEASPTNVVDFIMNAIAYRYELRGVNIIFRLYDVDQWHEIASVVTGECVSNVADRIKYLTGYYPVDFVPRNDSDEIEIRLRKCQKKSS